MALVGLSTIAVDIWGHGSRTYEDLNGDGVITVSDNDSNESGGGFLRVGPDVELSVGYALQAEWDLRRLVAMAQNNPEIQSALGIAPNGTNTFFYGYSLGGFLGSNLISGTPILSSGPPIAGYVLPATGGDLTDIAINGSFRQQVVDGVISTYGYDPSTEVGLAGLNSTLVALDMLTTHGFFKGVVDPMSRASNTSATPVLIQQMEGDLTLPNNNTTLLEYGMLTNRYADGDGIQTGSRVSWDYKACKYDLDVIDNASVLHGFGLDWTNTPVAALKSQTQAAGFFNSILSGGVITVIDPSDGLTGICN
jgi:hypothetical protein